MKYKMNHEYKLQFTNKKLGKTVSTHKSQLKCLSCMSHVKDEEQVVNHKWYT